jgi:hypothetical protein
MLCKKNGGLMAVMIAVLVCMVSANQSHGETSSPIKGSLSVETKGSGPALIFIPGLNSGKETFRATCDHSVAIARLCGSSCKTRLATGFFNRHARRDPGLYQHA